jgi:thioesterase domain-containing protein
MMGPLSTRRRDLLARLRTAGSEPATARPESSVAVKPDGARTPLFLVPAVSGSPYPYLPLRGLVHPEQPVESFEARGLSADEEPMTTIPAIAAAHVRAARRRWAGPYLLGGWSFGAAVALEMAHQLDSAGSQVRRLILIDGAVPGPYPEPTDDEVAAAFAADLAGYHLTPEAVADRAGSRRFAVFRANMRAYRSYRPRVWTGDGVVLRGADSSEPWQGWLDLIPGAAVRVVPGDHYSMWKPAAVSELAAAIDAAVAPDAGAA